MSRRACQSSRPWGLGEDDPRPRPTWGLQLPGALNSKLEGLRRGRGMQGLSVGRARAKGQPCRPGSSPGRASASCKPQKGSRKARPPARESLLTSGLPRWGDTWPLGAGVGRRPFQSGDPGALPRCQAFLPLAESTGVLMECSCCGIRVMTAHEAHRLPQHVHFATPIPNPPPATDAEHQVKTTKGSRWGRVSVISSLRPKWPKIRHSLSLEAHSPT